MMAAAAADVLIAFLALVVPLLDVADVVTALRLLLGVGLHKSRLEGDDVYVFVGFLANHLLYTLGSLQSR